MVQLSEGPVRRGNGKGGPTTPKPVILPKGQASARAALAEEQGLSDEEIDDQFYAHCYTDDFGNELMESAQFRKGARAVLARWGHQPTPPAEGEVAELVEWLKANSSGVYRPAARAAELLQQQHPTPVPVSEGLPGPEEMDGSLVWCGSQAAGLPYWEWCLDDIRHPGSSGYTHWLPANTPALPTALPLPQGEVK